MSLTHVQNIVSPPAINIDPNEEEYNRPFQQTFDSKSSIRDIDTNLWLVCTYATNT